MKKLYPYKTFVYEGIRDQMTPKPEENVRKALMKLSDSDKLLRSVQYGYFDIFLEVYNACRKSIEDDTNIKNMIFIEACKNGNYDVVEFMIDEGVDPTYLENKGLRYAQANGHKNIVSFLKKYVTNESIRDKMTGKSDRLEEWTRQDPDEVIKRFKSAFPQVRINEIRIYRVQLLLGITIESINLSEYVKIIEWFDKNTNYTVNSFKKRRDNCLFLDIDKKKSHKANESVRDMMTPKSSDDILETFENADGFERKKMFIKLIRDRFKYTEDFYDFTKFTLDISDWRRITKKVSERNRDFYELIDKLKKHEMDKLFRVLLKKKNGMNESIKDLMTPKSEDDIKKSLGDLSEEDICNRYISAIINADFATLDALKRTGYSVNSRNQDKQTPLMFICGYKWGSPQRVKTLVVKHGADMNLKDRNDRTALMNAVDNNNYKIVKELLKLDVDLKKWDQGARAMIRAVGKEKDYEIICDLLDAGVDVNYTDYNHSTALIYASLVVRRELVRLLITRGADVNIQNENGMTALMNAAKKDNQEIIKMLLNAGADVTLRNHGNQTAYDVAMVYHLEENAELIKNYKKINEGIRHLMTPKSKEDIISKFNNNPEKIFDISYKHDMVDVLKVALDGGVDPNYQTDRGTPYICLACAKGMYNFVEMLIKHGADVNIRGRRYRTPLIEAVIERHKDVVELLLKNKADVNLKDDVGETALMYSIDLGITKLLLKYGADKDIKDKYGNTALDYTRELNYPDVFNYLRKPTNESVRDMMTPKSKREIDDELEEMEPFERMSTIFDYQMKDINSGNKPYYSQEQIDRMIPDYIDTCNYIFDLYDKIDHLHYYIDLSQLIKDELKDSLRMLPASDQIQCVHDMKELGRLYTDSEWNELGRRAKEEERNGKKVNEGVRDMMTPIPKAEVDKVVIPMLNKITWFVLKLERTGMGTIGIESFEEASEYVKSKMDLIWNLVADYGTVDPYKIAVRICHEK